MRMAFWERGQTVDWHRLITGLLPPPHPLNLIRRHGLGQGEDDLGHQDQGVAEDQPGPVESGLLVHADGSGVSGLLKPSVTRDGPITLPKILNRPV